MEILCFFCWDEKQWIYICFLQKRNILSKENFKDVVKKFRIIGFLQNLFSIVKYCTSRSWQVCVDVSKWTETFLFPKLSLMNEERFIKLHQLLPLFYDSIHRWTTVDDDEPASFIEARRTCPRQCCWRREWSSTINGQHWGKLMTVPFMLGNL